MPIPDLRDRSVLVTGGAGFIGSHLVDALLSRGARVRVLDDLSTGRKGNLSHCIGKLDFIEGDIRDPATCSKACEGMDLVFHEAALGSVPRSMKDPATTISVNVCGTANVFAAARDRGARRVVYASSSSVYGDSVELPKVEGREGRPLSPYALSKVMNEQLAEVFGRAFGLELVGLRYFNVYGPRQNPDGPYAAVIPRFFSAILGGRRAVIYGDGRQSRDFTYVEDAVFANLLAAGAPRASSGAAYNVAGGFRITVLDLARSVSAALGTSEDPVHEPPRSGDVLHSQADLTRGRASLGFEPRVSLEEGLRRTLPFYKQKAEAEGSDSP